MASTISDDLGINQTVSVFRFLDPLGNRKYKPFLGETNILKQQNLPTHFQPRIYSKPTPPSEKSQEIGMSPVVSLNTWPKITGWP